MREECRRSRQGKEVGDRRCGKATEAQPSSGQISHQEANWPRSNTEIEEETWAERAARHRTKVAERW